MSDLAATTVRRAPAPIETIPSSPADSTLGSLLLIAKVTRAIYGIKLAAIGFHNGQDELLLAIDPAGTTVSAMADRLMVRPSTVSKMMDRLLEKGFVERVGDDRDARRTVIHLTASGKDVRNGVIDMRKAVDAELTKALNGGSPVRPGEASDATECLATCASALTKHLRRLR